MGVYKLLFLDQDEDDLILVKELLPMDQFELITFDSTYVDLEIDTLTRNLPDAVIMNFRLATTTYSNLIQAIRATPSTSHISIIVLSVLDPQLIEKSDLRHQVDDIIMKPYSYDEFPGFVERIKAAIIERVG